MSWEDVEAAVPKAKAIAFEGCHKIYVLLDDEAVVDMIVSGYWDNDTEGGSRLYTSAEMSPEIMLSQLHEWFTASCPLRFISSVETNEEDPNTGFTNLISQFEYGEEEEDSE